MNNQLGLKSKMILELIKEEDQTVKKLMKSCRMKCVKVFRIVAKLRHKYGFVEIVTKRKNNKLYVYHWENEKDEYRDRVQTINQRTKKAIKQIKISKLTNEKASQISHNKEISVAIQNSQNIKGEQLLLE